MQMDKARKEALLQELKHYINGKFAELKKELLGKPGKATKEASVAPMAKKKVEREKATRG